MSKYHCKCEDNQWCISALIKTHDEVDTGHYLRNALRKAMNAIANLEEKLNVDDINECTKVLM